MIQGISRTGVLLLVAVCALAAGVGAADSPADDHVSRFVADIVAVANGEARKRGVDPQSSSVRLSVSNRVSKEDKIILERLGVQETRLWVVYYFQETEPASVGGDITVYFREGSSEVVRVWVWD